MKKILLLVIAAIVTTASLAQPFVLTVDGFRDSKDTTKDYIVVQVPDADKAALFQKAKNYFTVTYNSPQNVMSESGADVVSVLGAEDIKYSSGKMGGSTATFKYKLIVELRDGRAKLTPLWVQLYDKDNTYPIRSHGGISPLGVFRKNGELRDAGAKSQMESIINPLVSGLEKALKETAASTSEDW